MGRDPNAQMAQYHMLTYCRLRLQEAEHVRIAKYVDKNLTKYTEVEKKHTVFICQNSTKNNNSGQGTNGNHNHNHKHNIASHAVILRKAIKRITS